MSGNAQFLTTRWTLVRQSRGDDTASRQALSDLCAAYYTPVVVFIQRSGFEEGVARDLAHDFFARVIGSPDTLKPDPQRGRFRSYLLGAVKHFVANALERARTQKRGGGQVVEHYTETGVPMPEDPALAPDRAFDRQWALTVLERVLARLAAEQSSAGKAPQFDALKPWLMGDDAGKSQAVLAQELGMNEGALKVAIHRLRRRFRDLLTEEIAETVDDAGSVRAELTHLLAAV